MLLQVTNPTATIFKTSTHVCCFAKKRHVLFHQLNILFLEQNGIAAPFSTNNFVKVTIFFGA